jgi:hypothetical protein
MKREDIASFSYRPANPFSAEGRGQPNTLTAESPTKSPTMSKHLRNVLPTFYEQFFTQALDTSSEKL